MRILNIFHIPDITSLPVDARTTFANECKRSLAAGIVETAETTFLLLIAVRYFHAAPFQKSLIASAGSFGLFLAPLTVYLVGLLQRKAAQSLFRRVFTTWRRCLSLLQHCFHGNGCLYLRPLSQYLLKTAPFPY